MPPSNVARLVSRAVTVVQVVEGKCRLNTDLHSWITVVDEHGLAEACVRTPRLAAKYSDWSVNEAIEAILDDNDKWPQPSQKVEVVARIITSRMNKAQVRSLASRRSKPPQVV